jgi:hypothetical protein
MSDLQTQILEKVFDNTMQGLPVYPDVLYPHYQGYSLSNIPSTICHLLDVPGFGECPISQEILDNLEGPYEKVILVVIDALGYKLLNHLMKTDKADYLKENLSDSVYVPMTSICPSTTASALTTLWTGVSPATHGVIGYEMWAKEYGMVINNILHSAMSYVGDTGGLKRAGFDPDVYLNRPTLGTHLLENGIESSAYMHYSIGTSGLSTMHLKKVNLHGYVSESDLWVSLRNKLNNSDGEKAYYYVYWSTIDTLTHRFGAEDERLAHEFSSFIGMMKSAFADGLTKRARKNTLVILTADHGSVVTPRYDQFALKNHSELVNMLRIQPTCENRLAFLYLKPGVENAVRAYFETHWPGKFSLISSTLATQSGLFGPEPFVSSLGDRVGDLIAIAHDDSYLWWVDKPNVMLGRHGGLHPEEMLIPFYAMPL